MELDTSQIEALRAAVALISQRVGDAQSFIEVLGPALKAQTETRIHFEKTDPRGDPWKPWSPSYAKTRNPAIHSLLIDTRAMVNTIEWHAYPDSVVVGSARPYAGRVNAARQFVGLSAQNERELESLAVQVLEGILANASAVA